MVILYIVFITAAQLVAYELIENWVMNPKEKK